jgi:serine/threonine protein kinase
MEDRVVQGEDDGYMKPGELHDKDELKPQNDLTADQKLVVALDMAEAIAVLHGNENGMIIHDDIQLSQYLFNADKSMIKINDFNRAEFPLFDEKSGEYCLYENGHGHGNVSWSFCGVELYDILCLRSCSVYCLQWRSPEEYQDGPLTEKIDVWSLGCNMYAILTGLNPLYDIKDGKKQRV